jgi:hypothetical protein
MRIETEILCLPATGWKILEIADWLKIFRI